MKSQTQAEGCSRLAMVAKRVKSFWTLRPAEGHRVIIWDDRFLFLLQKLQERVKWQLMTPKQESRWLEASEQVATESLGGRCPASPPQAVRVAHCLQ